MKRLKIWKRDINIKRRKGQQNKRDKRAKGIFFGNNTYKYTENTRIHELEYIYLIAVNNAIRSE